MQKIKVAPGERFNRLCNITEVDPIISGNRLVRRFLCICDCGNKTTVRLPDLRHNQVKSCGCLGLETKSRNGKNNRTHGETKTSMYYIWGGMKQRCYNTKSKDYPKYGGRGITVCQEWSESFIAFRDWINTNLGPRPSLSYSLDRVDNNGNYEPGNVRWATTSDQIRNSRSAKLTEDQAQKIRDLYTIGDVSQATLAKQFGVSRRSISFIIIGKTWK
jgi:hypothetical protein